jgi:hypothetical protein
MFNVTNPARRMHTMSRHDQRESKAELIDWKELLSGDWDYLRTMVEPLFKRRWKPR